MRKRRFTPLIQKDSSTGVQDRICDTFEKFQWALGRLNAKIFFAQVNFDYRRNLKQNCTFLRKNREMSRVPARLVHPTLLASMNDLSLHLLENTFDR